MDAQQTIAFAFSNEKNRNKTLSRMVSNKAFATKCPSTHSFLGNLQSQLLRRGDLSPAQSAALGRTMEKYIPIVIELSSATPTQLNEMNEADRHVQNDAGENTPLNGDVPPLDDTQSHE